MNCIFCDKSKISNIVYEDDFVIAFMDIDPINEGHILVIPKTHYLDMDEIPDNIISHLMIVSKKIVNVLKNIYKPDGYSIMQNGGEFNDIGHYHLHIFPRYKNDGFSWNYSDDEQNVNSVIAERIRDLLSNR